MLVTASKDTTSKLFDAKDFKELKGGKCSINDKIDVKIKTEEKHSAGSLTIIEKLKNEINKELEGSKENDFDEKGYRCELCNNIHLSESMVCFYGNIGLIGPLAKFQGYGIRPIG